MKPEVKQRLLDETRSAVANAIGLGDATAEEVVEVIRNEHCGLRVQDLNLVTVEGDGTVELLSLTLGKVLASWVEGSGVNNVDLGVKVPNVYLSDELEFAVKHATPGLEPGVFGFPGWDALIDFLKDPDNLRRALAGWPGDEADETYLCQQCRKTYPSRKSKAPHPVCFCSGECEHAYAQKNNKLPAVGGEIPLGKPETCNLTPPSPLAEVGASKLELKQLLALVQRWRFERDPDYCDCGLCRDTRLLLPGLPYRPRVDPRRLRHGDAFTVSLGQDVKLYQRLMTASGLAETHGLPAVNRCVPVWLIAHQPAGEQAVARAQGECLRVGDRVEVDGKLYQLNSPTPGKSVCYLVEIKDPT